MNDGLYVLGEDVLGKVAFIIVRDVTGWYCSTLFRKEPNLDVVLILKKKRKGWPLVPEHSKGAKLVIPEELLLW